MRPAFIPRDVFRLWLKPKDHDRHYRIDGIYPSSFIARCDRQARPVASRQKAGCRLFRAAAGNEWRAEERRQIVSAVVCQIDRDGICEGGRLMLPQPIHATAATIYRWRESKADDGLRAHLGASLIGHPCERFVWQSFRWVERALFDGRILRLFDRGKREEQVVIEELRGIGCEVHADDGSGQYRVSAHGGHFGGSMDGVVRGLPEAPRTWHLVEIKTHGSKSFADLVKRGVRESKPQHHAQMLAYMHLAELPRALYFAVNKDTDELHTERLEHDKAAGEALLAKARRLIEAAEPPARINDDPAWWQCKRCAFHAQCHGTAAPLPNCRTCLHATPVVEGDGGNWHCAHHGQALPVARQRKGCEAHRAIPILLERFAEPVDADPAANTVTYRNKATGAEFVNGGPGGVSSAEIRALADKAMLGQERVDPTLRQLREEFGGAYAG